jgi:hypothetical protein
VAEHEPAVALPARRGRELVDRLLQIVGLLAGRDPHERELRAIERPVRRRPLHRALERGRGLVVALRVKEERRERPQVERAARRRSAPRGGPQVQNGRVQIARRDRGARGVVMHDVAEHAHLDGGLGDLARGREFSLLEEREVELPQEHRVRRTVERRTRREAPAREPLARRGIFGGHRALEQLFRVRLDHHEAIYRANSPAGCS